VHNFVSLFAKASMFLTSDEACSFNNIRGTFSD
jgi:hypothetical protein